MVKLEIVTSGVLQTAILEWDAAVRAVHGEARRIAVGKTADVGQLVWLNAAVESARAQCEVLGHEISLQLDRCTE